MVRSIHDRVISGDYSSNSELIHEALRGWIDRDNRLKALDTAINKGVADAEVGWSHDIETVGEDLRKRFEI